MEKKFLDYLHSKLDCLIADDCFNIPQIQKKARFLAQFRYQDSNYNRYAQSYLLSAVCSYDCFLLKKLEAYIRDHVGE